MSIPLHCDHCGRKVEAPDSAGGKWGKCPACQAKLYIPSPEADEEITLAPLDTDEETRQQQLLAEERLLREAILSETEESGDKNRVTPPASLVSDTELTSNIITYLRQAASGDLEEAEQTAEAVTPLRDRALEIIDKIALSEMPEPELADIPPQVLSGLIRDLRSKIS